MAKNNSVFQEVSRITLTVHQDFENRVSAILNELGVKRVFVENSRCVRQKMGRRFLGLPGLKIELSDSPNQIYRFSVARQTAAGVLCRLIELLDLQTPGRGAVYSQDLLEMSGDGAASPQTEAPKFERLLDDLILITGIQSKSGSGQTLFKVALRLGVGVPVVGAGIGTGIRDRLGLLRITISPEKELVYLMVPRHDADGLQRLLIEEGHLDRPGGGFIYQTPIRAGMVDPLIRIGRQEHAASIEQIIAAIDDLKKNTSWRKRFFGVEATDAAAGGFNHREVGFFCPEGSGDAMVEAAMQAGAVGATVSRVRSFGLTEGSDSRSISGEHGIMCIPAVREKPVLQALQEVAEEFDHDNWVLQSLHASSVFSHQSG